MVNLKIPIILGILIILIFVACIFINNKEGFTSLIGTTNNSLTSKNLVSISGVYETVDSIYATEKVYNYVPYNVNLIRKGENVVLMVDKVTPLSRLGELCSSDSECISGKCDTTGSYNAKGRCIKSNASKTKTGDENTIKSTKVYAIFYVKSNKLYRYNSNDDSSKKYADNVEQISIGSANVCFYKTRNEEIWRIEIDENNETKVTRKILGRSVKSNISAVNKDFVYWAANQNRQLYRWQNNNNQTGGLTSYNVQTVAGVNDSCVWYISNNDDNYLGKNIWTSSTGWQDIQYTNWKTVAEISPVSHTICYYRCSGSYTSGSCNRKEGVQILKSNKIDSSSAVKYGNRWEGTSSGWMCPKSSSYFEQNSSSHWCGNGNQSDCTITNCNDRFCNNDNLSANNCNNIIYKVDGTSRTDISSVSGSTKILAIDSNSFYYFKDNNLMKYSNGKITSYPANSIHKMVSPETDVLFLMSNSNYSLYKIVDQNINSYPTSTQLTYLSDIQVGIKYVVDLPTNSFKRNNKKNFQGYLLTYGKIKRRLNGNEYINIITNPVQRENIGNYLNNLFPKNSQINIVRKNNNIYLKSLHNKLLYKKTENINSEVLNFDTNSLGNMTYNVMQTKQPNLSVDSELCPLGNHKCYDDSIDALFCGQQESGFSSGSVPNCKQNSIVCALNDSKRGFHSMCNGTFTLRDNKSTLRMIPTLLNINYYNQKNNPSINCRLVFEDLIKNKINNLSILTHVKNEHNKMVFKSLGTEFFNPGKDGSSLTVTDTPLTNFLNSNPSSSPTKFTKYFSVFMGLLIILSALEALDVEFLVKCREQLLRSKKCNDSSSQQNQLKNVCHKMLYDVQEVEAKIDNMEITQFKVEPASNKMSIGPNICSFYLKSYKSYSNLDPYYYATGHDNGSTSLSLTKGGHIQTRTVENKSYTNESQLWFFEGIDSFMINNNNMKVFRTLIRSQNGLYLEPSFGEIQGFSKMGGDNVYKVNLVRKPSKYWFVVATKFNSEVVMELSRTIESSVINSGITNSQNTTRTSYTCPKTYSKKMGNGIDGYYCCDSTVYGDNCSGSKCCLEPGLSGSCSDSCCPTDICPTDMPTKRNDRCYNSSGDSCNMNITGEGPSCYPN